MVPTSMMPGGRIVVDGLWRCLCPSIDLVYLYKPFDPSHLPQQLSPRPAHRRPSSQYPPTQYRRQYHGRVTLPIERQAKSYSSAERSRIAYLKRLARRNPWVSSAIFLNSDSIVPKLADIPTRLIYAALKELQVSEETYLPIARLVEYLVKTRGEQPNAALYECLIRANVSKRYGSAKVAGQLFKEMQDSNIATTPEIYQALLEVTAVHPDYILRTRVLHEMKYRWYSLAPSSKINIIIGFLRDGQYEHALAKLEELNSVPINVPPWLLDVFLYTFGELGFHEETLSILKYREGVVDTIKRVPLSLNAWHFLLDVYSRDVFQPGVRYVWSRSVMRGSIHPPDGVILNVLNAASMHGDAALAMSAIQVLSTRGTKLKLHHYEPLIQIYMQHGDLQRALAVLCIMTKAGLTPDLSTTRPIFESIRDSSTSTERALEILHQLKGQYTVPPAAFNVVLEATMKQQGFKVAFDLYRTVRQICVNGPDLETFDLLLQQCTQKKSLNFLVAEMDAFSLKPSRAMFDHLIRIGTMQDQYEVAFRYLDMMRKAAPPDAPGDWWISKGPALALLRRCIQARDSRYEGILKECQRRRLLSEGDIKSLVSMGASTSVVQSSSSPSPLIQEPPPPAELALLHSITA